MSQMRTITCSCCGSNSISKDGEFYVCSFCGTQYSYAEIQNMMNVRVDTSEKVANLLVLARRAKNNGDSETAAKYYEMILFDSPNCLEAMVFNAIYNSIDSRGKRTIIAFNSLKEIMLHTISEYNEPELVADASNTIKELLPALVDELVSNMTEAMLSQISSKLDIIDVLMDDGGAQRTRQVERASEDADSSFESISQLVQQQENAIFNFACSVVSLLEIKTNEYRDALLNMYKVKDEACYLTAYTAQYKSAIRSHPESQ